MTIRSTLRQCPQPGLQDRCNDRDAHRPPALAVWMAAWLQLRSEVQRRRDGVCGKRRHDATGGAENRNTAAATAQVQSPLAAPSAEAVIDRLSTEIAQFIDALALVPGGIGIEFDPERGGQHCGSEILHIVAHLRVRHAEGVVLGDIAVMGGILGPREAYTGGNPAAGLGRIPLLFRSPSDSD
jgi:hypothetical protein